MHKETLFKVNLHVLLQHLGSFIWHLATPHSHFNGCIRPLLTVELMHVVGLLVVGWDVGVGVALQKEDPRFAFG